MERPALDRLLRDIKDGKVDCVVVYKVDRLSRSLLDFAKMMETFDRNGVSFVSVTQQFNTSHSMGRLTLNILLSFAQFEREIIGERIRDKLAAQARKGKWTGGPPGSGLRRGPFRTEPSSRNQRERVGTRPRDLPDVLAGGVASSSGEGACPSELAHETDHHQLGT